MRVTQPTIPAIVRRTAELFSRHVSFRKRLPKRFGSARIVVTPDARLRMWTDSLGKLDGALLDAAAHAIAPGDHVWDIGANVGVFSFAAAAIAGLHGSILAIEPDLTLASLLRKSQQLQSPLHAPVDVLPVAVFNLIGVSRLNIARRGRASNSIDGFGRTEAGGVREIQLVPTFTLDSLLTHFPPPQVIKIDVEGAELQVLQGAAKLLAKHRPVVICEVGSACSAEVTNLLRQHAYEIYDYEAPLDDRIAPVKFAGASTLAIPQSVKTVNG